MTKFVSAQEIMKKFKITTQTLYNWRNAGTVQFKKINKRKFMYDLDSLESQNSDTRLIVSYSRVSTNKQKDDLIRQENLIKEYCCKNGIILDKSYSEIASGMNENRKQLNELLDEIIAGNIKVVYISYKDRLTRFGFDYFKNICNKLGCEIVVLNSTSEPTFEDELTQDLISIIHHFSMKMCSNRRKRFKELVKELKNEND